MRIMTFNLRADNLFDVTNRWKHRDQVVYETLKRYNCDIIGLQEVTFKMDEAITRHMENYHKTGEGRTKYFFPEKNPLFIKNDLTISQDQTFWLSKTPTKESSSIWYSLFPRICTSAICEIEGGRRIRVYNTHLDCILPHARVYGIRVIMKHIQEEQEKEYLPCILMGDFNAKPNSKLIRQLREGKYGASPFMAVQEMKPQIYRETTMGCFKGKQLGRHIDYIFVTEEFRVKEVEIIRYEEKGQYPSDHYPIITELEL